MNEVAILLSTYNGEEYITQQLDSLLSQTYKGWHLFIRDDGSSDTTYKIIKDYEQKYSSKISILPSAENLGCARSFLNILEKVDAKYYAFCDQDDVWDDKKLEVLINKLKKEENINPELPLLCCCDALVVDENLELQYSSLWAISKLHPRKINSNKDLILYFNVAPGCSTVFNKKLKDVYESMHISPNIMHDKLCNVIAVKHGKLLYVDAPLVNYRQHSKNVIGAVAIDNSYFKSKRKNIKETFLKQLELYRIIKFFTKISLPRYYVMKLYYNIKRANNEYR